jgi:catechol 2,3-dioxygenase-like lactoylglutathione lyase family enzyme
MTKVISGIQQVGIGIPDEKKAFDWYREHFGMDIPIFQEAAEAPLMIDYTGDKVQSRSATLAINLQGGGGFEIWQFTSRDTEAPEFNVQLGDLGIFVSRIKSFDVKRTYKRFQNNGQIETISELLTDPAGSPHFFVRDPHGLIFQIVEGGGWFTTGYHHTGGQAGAMIGVTDVEESLKLYRDILGYDKVIYDETGVFEDFAPLPGGDQKVRRVLLEHSKPRKGSFSRLLGPSKLELVKVFDREPNKIFEDRYWGDLGFIHLCFDIKGMDALREECEAAGFPFTVDSKDSFDMGEAAGHFSYIEDPDGTLIEFVETHKIPILKKIGWYLDVRKKDPEKPLPNWMIKALKFNRVKN